MNAFTMTDITNDEGKLIKEAEMVQPYESMSANAYEWSTWPSPAVDDVCLWKHALKTTIGLSRSRRSQYSY